MHGAQLCLSASPAVWVTGLPLIILLVPAVFVLVQVHPSLISDGILKVTAGAGMALPPDLVAQPAQSQVTL